VNGVTEAESPSGPPKKKWAFGRKKALFLLPIRIFRARNSVT
jgi:hypothetical protein